MQNHKKLDSLQGLRAIAAILVVFFHISGTFQARLDYSFAFNLFSFGFTGVDIFFVLSGFIMYNSYINYQSTTSTQFFIKRFIRIFPLYWIWLITILGIYYVEKHFSFVTTSTSSTTLLLDKNNLSIIIKSFLLIPNDVQKFFPSWTLSYEMAFYFVFGFFYFRNPRWFLWALTFWVALCYLNFYFIHINFKNNINANPMRYFLCPIITEFLLGCMIAKLFIHYPEKYPKTLLATGSIFFILSGIVIDYSLPIQNSRVFFFGFPAALIIYGLINAKIKIPRFVKYLGDASYSIYLFHALMGFALLKTVSIFGLIHNISNFFGFLCICGFSILGCCVIYTFIEEPILLFCKNKMLSSFK